MTQDKVVHLGKKKAVTRRAGAVGEVATVVVAFVVVVVVVVVVSIVVLVGVVDVVSPAKFRFQTRALIWRHDKNYGRL